MQKVATLITHKDYNDFLPEAIDSCLNQTYKNDIFLVDDGSVIKPYDFLNKVFGEPKNQKDSVYYYNVGEFNLIYIELDKNYGPSTARNVALDIIVDNYDACMILDADDRMVKNKIEKMVNILNKDIEQIGVVYADYYELDIEQLTLLPEFKYPYDRDELFKRCIVHSGSLINTKALAWRFSEKGYFYNDALRTCEDYDLWLDISREFMIIHIPEFLTVVKNHRNNSTNSVQVETWNENLQWVLQNAKY